MDQKPLITNQASITNQKSFTNNNGKRSTTMQNSQERGITPTKRGLTPLPPGALSNPNLNKSQPEGFALHAPEDEHEGAANYKKAIVDLEDTIKDLDVKLNRVLAKQEYEYLKGYNVYVKQKERELKDTINQLSERYNNTGAKDKKLATLQTAIKTIREEQIKMDNDNKGMKERLKKLKASNEELVSERDFYQSKAKDVKKKNQLLKLAILRLQNEVESMKRAGEERKVEEYEQEKSQFFITELGMGAKKGNSPKAQLITSPTGATGFLLTTDPNHLQSKTIETTLDESAPGTVRKNLNTTLQDISQTQLMEPSIVSLNHTLSKKGASLLGGSASHLKSKTAAHNRVKSNTTISRYANISTDNLKFRTFIEALFTSKMTNPDIKEEIKAYVEVLETNYNDTIRDLKSQIDRLQKQVRNARSERSNAQIEKTEFEAIFVECIEDVRKEIMKRRLKNEIQARKKSIEKKGRESTKEEEASREFEDSLMKLASFAKGRIKYEDFNSKDKFNILDLFVNNEKTLIKIYEALFPHRQGGAGPIGPGSQVHNRNLLGSVASVSSTSTNDRTVGRYGYHSGVNMPQNPINAQSGTIDVSKPNIHLQFATPGSKLLLNTTATPSPQLHSPHLMTNGAKYGSSLYGGKLGLKVDSGAVTMATSGAHMPRDTSGPRFNQESGLQLPSIVSAHQYSSGAQSSLR